MLHEQKLLEKVKDAEEHSNEELVVERIRSRKMHRILKITCIHLKK